MCIRDRFRTKFERDVEELEGTLGIGCISDSDPQPLMVQSHLGSFAITTVGKINNMDQLVKHSFANGCTHFLEMSGGNINATEMVASLINQKTVSYTHLDVYKRQGSILRNFSILKNCNMIAEPGTGHTMRNKYCCFSRYQFRKTLINFIFCPRI